MALMPAAGVHAGLCHPQPWPGESHLFGLCTDSSAPLSPAQLPDHVAPIFTTPILPLFHLFTCSTPPSPSLLGTRSSCSLRVAGRSSRVSALHGNPDITAGRGAIWLGKP